MVRSAKLPEKTIRVPKAKLEKPAAETNGPAVADLETFHYHVGEIRRKKAVVDIHRKNLKAARRKAQDSGIVLHDLDTVLRMSEEEPETVQEGIRRLATYAHWMGLSPGVQGDLFEAADTAQDLDTIAEQEGLIDGLQGITAEGDRYEPTNRYGAARLKGWRKGQAIVAERFMQVADAAE